MPKLHESTQDFPTDVQITAARITRRNAVGISRSPFSGKSETMVFPGQMWELRLEFLPMTRAEAGKLEAFLTSLRGPAGTFRQGDPFQSLPQGSNTGTPLLAGAATAGSQTVATDGWTASTTGQLKANDMIQIGDDLYVVLEDADSDSGGASTLKVWPDLREAYADNSPVVTSNARGIWRLVDSGQVFSRNQLERFGTSLHAIEAL